MLFALLCAALALIWLSPLVLRLNTWSTSHPLATIRIWLCVFAVGSSWLVISIVGLTWTGAEIASEKSVNGRVDANTIFNLIVLILAWGLLLLIGATLGLVTLQLDPILLGSKSAASYAIDAQISTVGIVNGAAMDPVIVVENDFEFAYSTTEKPTKIVVSTGLIRLLTKAQLAAVIEHELSHQRRHHFWIRALAQLNRACLPFVAATSEFDRSTRILIELVADDDAARNGHGEPLASALNVLAQRHGNRSMELRAARISERCGPQT